MHLREVCKTALGERSQQVERRCRLVVRRDQPLGVRAASLQGRGIVVDDVAAEGGELHPVDHLVGRRTWLGELACDAAHLDHLGPRAVGEHHGHLQDDLELVPDAVGGEIVEGLRVVARLKKERPTSSDFRQGAAQGAGLPGENQRGKRGKHLQGLFERVLVRPFRLLLRGQAPPRCAGPIRSRG